MKVAVLEDLKVHRERLRIVLEGEPGIELVGFFSDGESFLEELSHLPIDILICDLGLPGISGEEVILALKELCPETDVMTFTVHDDEEAVFAALRAGANSYLLKDSSPKEIISALKELHSGGSPLSPKIARLVLAEFSAKKTQTYLLTSQEQNVLRNIENGSTYKEVAGELSVSVNTINFHIKNIYSKLNVKCKQEAISKARQSGALR